MQINWSVYQNDINAIKQLWEAAHIDALTKLYNRYGMETWITQQLKEKDADDQAAMLVLDVDNFKYVNDTFGHMLGDALLVDIADMIRTLFPDDFFCGRIGGDEYQIFALNISISIGIAFSEENRGQDYAELYKMADLTLYQAKEEGKNGYMLYGDNMTKKPTQISQEHRHKKQIIQLGESFQTHCRFF